MKEAQTTRDTRRNNYRKNGYAGRNGRNSFRKNQEKDNIVQFAITPELMQEEIIRPMKKRGWNSWKDIFQEASRERRKNGSTMEINEMDGAIAFGQLVGIIREKTLPMEKELRRKGHAIEVEIGFQKVDAKQKDFLRRELHKALGRAMLKLHQMESVAIDHAVEEMYQFYEEKNKEKEARLMIA